MAKTERIANGGRYSGCGENLIPLKDFCLHFAEKLTERKFLCKGHQLPFRVNSGKSGRGGEGEDAWDVSRRISEITNMVFPMR